MKSVLLGSVFACACMAGNAATYIKFVSDPGDYIGGGVTATWQEKDGEFKSFVDYQKGADIRFYGGQTWWDLTFSAPNNERLVPGVYEMATRAPFKSLTAPGLDVGGSGRGCNTLTGQFEVLEVSYGADGAVDRFAAKFEQHCEGGAPALRGSVHFNSTIPPTDLNPEVYVRVGGKSSPVEVKVGQSVKVDVKVAANGKAGTAAEHWVGILGPKGNQWFNGAGWVTLNKPIPAKIDWLADGTASYQVTPQSPGAYLFQYAIDEGVNNSLDAKTINQIVIIAK